jgi:hypothetical protein
MARFSNTNHQPSQPPQIILPPSTRTTPVDFDEEKVPLSQRLGDFSDTVFGFIFSPNLIKFGILVFAGFCIAINLAGYYDLIGQVFSTRLDEFGRTLPVDAPVSDRIVSSAVRSTGETMAILRWLSLAGVLAYMADAYAMNLSRPWLDNLGNPLWLNMIWNGLAVLGVELSLVLYRGYKAVTLSAAEKADKDRY